LIKTARKWTDNFCRRHLRRAGEKRPAQNQRSQQGAERYQPPHPWRLRHCLSSFWV